MWAWLNEQLIIPLTSWLGGALAFFVANATTVVGFILALLIIRRVLTEKRNPSNFFAWFFLVLFFPLVGVPLYFMFGGRKSRKSSRIKREIAEAARALTDELHAQRPRPHDMLAYEGGNTVTTGNHFKLLPDGETAFHRICAEIEKAEHTIHIATYILSRDATGNTIVDLLAKRAAEGITVRLLLDSLGSWNQTRAARYKIRKAGGHVAMFMPVLPIQTQISSNLRNHRKIAIFDNYRAITGGQNLDMRFMGATPTPERFTDFSVVTQGPAVAHLTRTFLADWAFAAKESPTKHRKILCHVPEEAGDSTIEVIASGPDVPNDPLWEQIIRIIQEFKQNLTIITPYFIPDEVLFQSLIVKAHTGRYIRLVLPLQSNHSIADIARHHYLRKLNQAGVEILFYTPRMLHGKVILADGRVGLVGSANIDMRSLFVNFEIALLHYTPQDIQKLEQWAQGIIEDSITYAEATADKQLMPAKFTESLVHLLVPLL
ncbi:MULTISPECIES: cardiolipin synthase [unclassified Lentimonas]|nr:MULTISPECIES: cardiolipin synthase [unclassified Lentimonas]CAA7168120.1 Cardiolipin synthetase (EC [Lentimonas sp. CC21]CAA7181732.1 Cardiolipin synthetase (EC [Lentimonas sp. CC8]CAA6676896.1 Cardiolipin synthetase (EC [Lentimonas sp. CC4]CAA6686702.1 Cardiolipin synthetase (EC [Lentimonas sp. CC6]CAA7075721.1 Cardiolipin synthetase (EC [Lentimonas sp. CC4]